MQYFLIFYFYIKLFSIHKIYYKIKKFKAYKKYYNKKIVK